jgi:undecaprenyl diphosphate synthase
MSTDLRSIGIIMDGNRRWAKEQGLPSLAGHKAGYERLKDVVRWAKEAAISHVIFYAFSTENWKRTTEEVGYLMDLLRFAITNELAELKKEKVSVRFIGDMDRLPDDIKKGAQDVEEKTKGGDITLVLAISYGGRDEIIRAVKRMQAAGEVCTEESLAKYLDTTGIPDPDLVIRTSGEERISNFLLWQIAYSELYFTKTYWPALTKEEFMSILDRVKARDRRKGI